MEFPPSNSSEERGGATSAQQPAWNASLATAAMTLWLGLVLVVFLWIRVWSSSTVVHLLAKLKGH
jgi:hypothetical protein